MTLVELRWTPYAVPFARGFATAHGGWRVREGVIVRTVTDRGVVGTGEIAPLPSHGTLPNSGQLSALERIAPHLLGAEIGELGARVDAALGEGTPYAPLRCGVETAALDATARAAGVSVATLLSRDAASHVRVNAVIDAAPCAEAAAAAARAVARGFRDLKLKAGGARDAATEEARVAAVREAAGPGVRLRLDANGAWTEQQAIDMIRSVERYGIELVEQPVPPGDAAALRRVREAVRTPVAADESVTGIAAVRALLDARAVDAVVVKLPVAGGPLRALEIARMAAAAGVDAVVTSAFDAGIGVTAALHVAAARPRPVTACGLATLELLEDDLIDEGLRIDAGDMPVPGAPGLGVTIDERALARYATGPERVVRA